MCQILRKYFNSWKIINCWKDLLKCQGRIEKNSLTFKKVCQKLENACVQKFEKMRKGLRKCAKTWQSELRHEKLCFI